jgi:hypothetical protein
MNSRDAAFDESLKEIIEATAAEAAAAEYTTPPTEAAQPEVIDKNKKRKRSEDETWVSLSRFLLLSDLPEELRRNVRGLPP